MTTPTPTLPPLPCPKYGHLPNEKDDTAYAAFSEQQMNEHYLKGYNDARAAIEAQGVPDGWRELMSEALDNALASTVEAGISHDRRNYRRELAQRIKQALNASDPPAPQASGYGPKLMPQVSGYGEQPETDSVASPQQEPVSGQCRLKKERQWSSCSVEHVKEVLSHPAEWSSDYEVRYLYTHPAKRAKPQPLTTRELAAVTSPWADVWTDKSFGIANAAIAKFCEVNGIDYGIAESTMLTDEPRRSASNSMAPPAAQD